MSNRSNTTAALSDFTSMPQLLCSQQQYRLIDTKKSNQALEVRCLEVTQRNWSRVATGLVTEPSVGQNRLFLKQYVDRAGESNEKLWSYERSGVEIAEVALGQHICIPKLVASDRTLLINAFEHEEILSMDELLRADRAAFESAYPIALECMFEILHQLKVHDTEGYQLPQKTRDFGDDILCLNFKGFELRNMGVHTLIQGIPKHEDFFLFDFGRPYLAPIQEAAAKLFVSIGLLNWGRPLSRFSKGPDFKLLEAARQRFLPYLDHKAIAAEIQLQRSFRWAEIQGTGSLERSVKRLAINTLGGRYFYRLENWCKSALS